MVDDLTLGPALALTLGCSYALSRSSCRESRFGLPLEAGRDVLILSRLAFLFQRLGHQWWHKVVHVAVQQCDLTNQ